MLYAACLSLLQAALTRKRPEISFLLHLQAHLFFTESRHLSRSELLLLLPNFVFLSLLLNLAGDAAGPFGVGHLGQVEQVSFSLKLLSLLTFFLLFENWDEMGLKLSSQRLFILVPCPPQVCQQLLHFLQRDRNTFPSASILTITRTPIFFFLVDSGTLKLAISSPSPHGLTLRLGLHLFGRGFGDAIDSVVVQNIVYAVLSVPAIRLDSLEMAVSVVCITYSERHVYPACLFDISLFLHLIADPLGMHHGPLCQLLKHHDLAIGTVSP